MKRKKDKDERIDNERCILADSQPAFPSIFPCRRYLENADQLISVFRWCVFLEPGEKERERAVPLFVWSRTRGSRKEREWRKGRDAS